MKNLKADILIKGSVKIGYKRNPEVSNIPKEDAFWKQGTSSFILAMCVTTLFTEDKEAGIQQRSRHLNP